MTTISSGGAEGTTGPHVPDGTLHDYADAVLSDGEREAVDAHLRQCGDCRARLDRVRGLLRGAAALARAVEPADDLWPGIRAEIERRKVVPIGGGGGATAGRPAWWRAPAVRLAAAGLALVALSSSATVAVMNWSGARGPAAAPAGTTTAAAPADDPGHDDAAVEFVRLEGDYQRLARELEAALDARRDSLSPETVATVERSVRVIDAAIAEARAALAREPGNRALVEMLTTSYRQKLDLLKRTSQMAAGA